MLFHFIYCLLVWYFTIAKGLNRIEKIQERALRLIIDDYISICEDPLINTGMTGMHTNWTNAKPIH